MSNLIKLLVLFFVFLVAYSCNEKRRLKKDIPVYSDLYTVSVNQIGKEKYNMIYRSAFDSLQKFSNRKLDSFKDIAGTKWNLDSLLCFNKLQDKCIMAFYVQYGEHVSNGLNYLYGVKINKRWYFFRGPHFYIQSEAYGFRKKNPLPFEKLHEIAMDNIFKGYLNKSKQSGDWEINKEFFSDFTSGAYGGNEPKTKAQWDSVYLRVVRNNWSSRDMTNYQPLQ